METARHDSIDFFLGATTPAGFKGYFEPLRHEPGMQMYLIKSGPGCGKSTLMKRLARAAEQRGELTQRIHCASDPDSLDGVIFLDQKRAIIDATAPHVVEPKYPGAVEQYVNLGDCYDRAGLRAIRGEILTCMDGYKEHYQRAYRCLDAAAEIQTDVRAMLATPALEEKLAARAHGILSRELKPKRSAPSGRVKQRFLDAVSHKGLITLFQTACAQCTRIYELSDSYGLAHLLLTHLLAGGVMGGYDVVACPDPMAPDRLSHLLVPEVGLAFLSASPACPFPGRPSRRLRLDAMVDRELLRRCRARLRFARKVSSALTGEAVESLAQAKAMHDGLEALYNPYVDFDRGQEMADRIAEELLALD